MSDPVGTIITIIKIINEIKNSADRSNQCVDECNRISTKLKQLEPILERLATSEYTQSRISSVSTLNSLVELSTDINAFIKRFEPTKGIFSKIFRMSTSQSDLDALSDYNARLTSTLDVFVALTVDKTAKTVDRIAQHIGIDITAESGRGCPIKTITSSLGWNGNLDSNLLEYSMGDNCKIVTKRKIEGVPACWNASTMSYWPTTGFAIEILHGNSVMVGFIHKNVYGPNQMLFMKENAFVFYVYDGKLYGSGNYETPYVDRNPNPLGTVVQCMYNRGNHTISFAINGIDQGVAFRNVPDIELYALLELHGPETSVKLL